MHRRTRWVLPLAVLPVVAALPLLTAAPAAATGLVTRVINIASMGDSVAAGVGVAGDRLDTACDRHWNSGVNLAVNAIKVGNPQFEVNHVNVTCTGAKIDGTPADYSGGILSPQVDSSGAVTHPAQLDQVNTRFPAGSVIDALTIGAGGEDAGLSRLINDCGDGWDADSGRVELGCQRTKAQQFEDDLAQMRANFRKLINAVQGNGSAGATGKQLRAKARAVFLTAYPDPARKNGSTSCHDDPWWDDIMGDIMNWESSWLSETVIPRINQVIDEAAAEANARPGEHPFWQVVHASPDWAQHGWCAGDQRWANTYGDVHRFDATGLPNLAGQISLGTAIGDALAYLSNPVPTWGVRLVNAANLQGLDVGWRPASAGVPVIQAAAGYETFWFERSFDPLSTQVKSRSSGACLGRDAADAGRVALRPCYEAGTDWHVVPAPFGGWSIENSLTGQCLELPGGGEGTPLRQNPCRWDPSQKWWLDWNTSLELSKTGWTAWADSSETSSQYAAPASHAIDGNPDTFWHTQWTTATAPMPHWITVDLGATTTIDGIVYQPRRDGSVVGTIRDYEVWTYSGTAWERRATGTFQAGSGGSERIGFGPTPTQYVKLVALSEASVGGPWANVAELGVTVPDTSAELPRSGWRTTVDSEETTACACDGAKAVDGDPRTTWFSRWTGTTAPLPHSISVNLGGNYVVDGIVYQPNLAVPRPVGANAGSVGRFEVYVSTDGTTWGDPVAAGTLADVTSAQRIRFAERPARHLKVVALSEAGNRGPWTAVAELGITGRPAS
ncbi:discoidin domain-containing protein [Dactylosporangium sp. CA-092794]|uniref:discoidin domain-containing protein n=1 Tax=Dactylosporangium sp. CA-092794 TaxID=3239929 RepID=UPI003D90F72F